MIFGLEDEEKTHAVELLRRVEEFCGVMVLAYAIMSNHFHIYIYVPEPEEIDDEKARRGYAFMYGSADHWDVIRDSHEKSMREAMSEILAARCIFACELGKIQIETGKCIFAETAADVESPFRRSPEGAL